ncbi:MAG: hypothetical protein HN390_00355 [Anaerolineae bacterium]|jgi:hypothetical protein|nr:hypothetical protein [Anaerolineae bacterium]MBT7189984.1 hypothetical protein [Anaerolineae bacterium]MBT7990682.1 hypothetical protein [Anaerolineae bacterium]
MGNRRNPFGDVPANESAPATPPDIYDSLPVAEPRQRKRDWERAHQNEKVVYRGVDPQAALQVRQLAEELNVPVGEVARALLEHGLIAYSRGDLNLAPRLNPERLRMTLFPKKDVSKRKAGKAGKRKDGKEASWRVVTTWRNFSAELKDEIGILASDKGLDIPVGELVSAFLQFALRAYESGDLPLQPVEKVVGYKLAQEGDF